ncbi:hypothetical protein VP01_3748g1 [Puccinia sorghi]|uniref:Uncharacterized protein n=1 Tax=Puccinia sorghi TaxID=27349 RepID=A0A0L6UTV5_9BASI|nr:hypothetical protein VP01_3748g1 [Puccinia sorghi]
MIYFYFFNTLKILFIGILSTSVLSVLPMPNTALEMKPQLMDENYSIWKDKKEALLQLWGVLIKLNSPTASLSDNENDGLKLLLIAKMDSIKHNNVVTSDKSNSAKMLWLLINTLHPLKPQTRPKSSMTFSISLSRNMRLRLSSPVLTKRRLGVLNSVQISIYAQHSQETNDAYGQRPHSGCQLCV